MKKAMLVMNPRSGKGKAPLIEKLAIGIAREHGYELDVRKVERHGHGTELAQEAVSSGMDMVVSAGGDGTLNSIAAGLIGTKVPLGIIPLGSGNGYARSLELPLKPEDALHRAFTGTPKLMDVCYLNDQAFLGVAGIGFDARVAHRFDKSKGRGMWGYAKIIIQEVLGAKTMHVSVHANGEQITEELLMLVFCNTREFGNGADISPGSRPDDGLAELRLVRKPPFLSMLKALWQMYTHRADDSKHIRNVVTTKATVLQTGTLAHLDGEPVEVGNEVRFRLEAERLWLVV
ncbi:MAG: diacylglycerol kinase family protein [Flavobacteriales bacterium]